jgi:hypothetical protein
MIEHHRSNPVGADELALLLGQVEQALATVGQVSDRGGMDCDQPWKQVATFIVWHSPR